MGNLLQMKLNAYNYRPISAQSLIPQDALIDQIFPNLHRQYTNHEWLAKKSNFNSNKCGRQGIEAHNTTFVTRILGVIQIY
jgi:hypothetical protein